MAKTTLLYALYATTTTKKLGGGGGVREKETFNGDRHRHSYVKQ